VLPPPNGRSRLPQDNAQASDLVWGGRNIAARIGRSLSSTYKLHAKRLLPTTMIGGVLVGRGSELDRPECWPKASEGVIADA
jgi:hypothetical protein